MIDTFGWTEAELRQRAPAVYQHLVNHVRDARATNRDPRVARRWWLFRRSSENIRAALRGIKRYIVTPETATHRVFVFVDANVRPEHKLVVIASDDAAVLGALSSRIHQVWAVAAGGRRGVGDDPVYSKTTCFECFPFPKLNVSLAEYGEQVDRHRKRQQSLYSDLTITGMYNVLEKLRREESLTDRDKVIHEQGLVSVLKHIHDDLDAAVFDAYGWPHGLTDEEILDRLVALNVERAAEERRGVIQWLRPAFQEAVDCQTAQQTITGVEIEPHEAAETTPKQTAPWPKELPAQIAAVRDLLTVGGNGDESWTVARTARAFKGAKRRQVRAVLDSLAALGLLITFGEGDDRQWRAAARERRTETAS